MLYFIYQKAVPNFYCINHEKAILLVGVSICSDGMRPKPTDKHPYENTTKKKPTRYAEPL